MGNLLQLRHTYLRVLHPLLTKTQLRSIPYKRPQISMALESLIQNGDIRDINPTTKRLVERCLSGEWCVQLRTSKENKRPELCERVGSPSSESATSTTPTVNHLSASAEPSMSTALNLERSASTSKSRTLKTSKSVEFIKGGLQKEKRARLPTDRMRGPSNASSLNLAGATSTPPSPLSTSPTKRRELPDLAHTDDNFGLLPDRCLQTHDDRTPPSARSLPSPRIPDQNCVSPPAANTTHRRPPPTPPKRRKPPAIPLGSPNGGTTMTAIKSSATGLSLLGSKSPSSQQIVLSPHRSSL